MNLASACINYINCQPAIYVSLSYIIFYFKMCGGGYVGLYSRSLSEKYVGFHFLQVLKISKFTVAFFDLSDFCLIFLS